MYDAQSKLALAVSSRHLLRHLWAYMAFSMTDSPCFFGSSHRLRSGHMGVVRAVDAPRMVMCNPAVVVRRHCRYRCRCTCSTSGLAPKTKAAIINATNSSIRRQHCSIFGIVGFLAMDSPRLHNIFRYSQSGSPGVR